MTLTFSSFFILLSLTFFYIAQAGRSVASSTPLITEACSQSPNKDLCEKIIDSDHSSPRNNLNDIAFIAFDQTDNAATGNMEFISQTLAVSEKSKDPVQAGITKAFTECDKQYESASDAIDNAISGLTAGTKAEEIEKFLKDAVTGIEKCQQSIKDQDGKADQLENMNNYLLDLLNNALSVYHAYKQKN